MSGQRSHVDTFAHGAGDDQLGLRHARSQLGEGVQEEVQALVARPGAEEEDARRGGVGCRHRGPREDAFIPVGYHLDAPYLWPEIEQLAARLVAEHEGRVETLIGGPERPTQQPERPVRGVEGSFSTLLVEWSRLVCDDGPGRHGRPTCKPGEEPSVDGEAPDGPQGSVDVIVAQVGDNAPPRFEVPSRSQRSSRLVQKRWEHARRRRMPRRQKRKYLEARHLGQQLGIVAGEQFDTMAVTREGFSQLEGEMKETTRWRELD